MPLPLILIPIGIVAVAAAAGSSGGMTLNARSKIKKAHAEYQAAYNAYKVKHDELRQYHTGTNTRLQELGQARANAMGTVREAIAFIKRAKLANPDIISDAEVTIPDLESLDQAYADVLKAVYAGAGIGVVGAAGTGALGALGAYGLVGTLGVASTGTAIGSLSGAAATSATLAWLGGGSLAAGGLGVAGAAAGLSGIGGLVAAPVLIGFGVFAQMKAGKAKKKSAEEIQKLKVKEAQISRERAKLQTVRQRCDEMQRTVLELNGQLKVALQNASPNIAQDVHRIVQIAKALRAAIDEPVVANAA